jgi:hypothetical protein
LHRLPCSLLDHLIHTASIVVPLSLIVDLSGTRSGSSWPHLSKVDARGRDRVIR